MMNFIICAWYNTKGDLRYYLTTDDREVWLDLNYKIEVPEVEMEDDVIEIEVDMFSLENVGGE